MGEMGAGVNQHRVNVLESSSSVEKGAVDQEVACCNIYVCRQLPGTGQAPLVDGSSPGKGPPSA